MQASALALESPDEGVQIFGRRGILQHALHHTLHNGPGQTDNNSVRDGGWQPWRVQLMAAAFIDSAKVLARRV